MEKPQSFFRRFFTACKYAIIGVSTWLIDNALFTLLKIIFGDNVLFKFPVHITTLHVFTAIGMVAGFLFSFFMNRNWTFKSDGKTGRQFIRCILLLIFNTAITAAVVDFSGSFGISYLPDLVKYGMSGVIGVWNYFAYKMWVYK